MILFELLFVLLSLLSSIKDLVGKAMLLYCTVVVFLT